MRVSRICGVAVSLLLASGLPAVAQTAGVQYLYDELGRLIAVVDAAGDTAVYHYDAVGNVLSIDRHASSQVSVISFTPASGPVSATVTVSGTGFWGEPLC
jgi:YD repeat-containing protein